MFLLKNLLDHFDFFTTIESEESIAKSSSMI